jgi:hypothetical protein
MLDIVNLVKNLIVNRWNGGEDGEDGSKIYLTGHADKDIEIVPHSGRTVIIDGVSIADIMSALSVLATGYTGTLTVVTDVSLSGGVLTKTTKQLTFSAGRLQSIV